MYKGQRRVQYFFLSFPLQFNDSKSLLIWNPEVFWLGFMKAKFLYAQDMHLIFYPYPYPFCVYFMLYDNLNHRQKPSGFQIKSDLLSLNKRGKEKEGEDIISHFWHNFCLKKQCF